MCHTEGGWPAEVDLTDGEQVARWRKKVERDEDYIRTVLQLGAIVEDLVRQNNALDIYADYFADEVPLTLEPPSMSTLAALRHPKMGALRAVQAVSWNPDGSGHISAAYSGAANEESSGFIAIFDMGSPTTPLATLTAASPALCLAYNPRYHELLGAGLRNGQIALFDGRQGSNPCALTDPDSNHADCCTALAWTQTQSAAGTELMTAGVDGTVMFWDSRKMSERLEVIPLKENSGDGPCLAATCLEYSAAADPVNFMVGTSSGSILSGNRKTTTELPANRISGAFNGHVGAVRALSRHPLFPKYFLSVGDWTARVWREDQKTSLSATPCHSEYLTAGAWSQLRPSVFYCTSVDGSIEAWDLLHSYAAPVLTTNLADSPLTALSLQQDAAGGQPSLLAVGCGDGSTLLVRPSAGLSNSQGDETAAFAAMLERESGRERALGEAGKEAKAGAARALELVS